jgi:hypothetical protein
LKARLTIVQDHPEDPLAREALFKVTHGYHQLGY